MYTAPGYTDQNALDASISSTIAPPSASFTTYRSSSTVRMLTPRAGSPDVFTLEPIQRSRSSASRETVGSRPNRLARIKPAHASGSAAPKYVLASSP